jgi:glucoamylase
MAQPRGNHEAFGQPGLPPRWSPGDKDGIGTAYAASSRVWYTLWKGSLSEIYYPTVDRPQTRDLRLIFSDGKRCLDETQFDIEIELLEDTLGHKVQGRHKEAGFGFDKEIICDPHAACVLQRIKMVGEPSVLDTWKVYVLCSPHIGGCNGNTGEVLRGYERVLVAAHRGTTWLAVAATVPFVKASAGYVGVSDGWTDVAQHFGMEWEFDRAPDGNVALMGELDVSATREFILSIAFGDSRHNAITTLTQSLVLPYEGKRERFIEQWRRTEGIRMPLEQYSGDGGRLYRNSHKLLLAHEDKAFSGAMVASLAIPWGAAKDDHEGEAGYHLVWTRDMVHSAMGLLAAGNKETPFRALLYLAATQREDGGFAQNFWVDGEAFWTGSQMDEVAFPVLLAHRIWKEGGLGDFDAGPMIKRAMGYLIREGPATRQERWEEASGYSPSTLAVVIAAFICAAEFARAGGRDDVALFLEQYADWLESNLEKWTVTHAGELLPGISTHFVRILPDRPGEEPPDDAVDRAVLRLSSQPAGMPVDYPAKMIVDAGFLELVRYGIRRADDPLMVDSLKVVDACLKMKTPSGTAWHRYNHDGYGERADGGPYQGQGQGRLWPLLAGERGHYELAAGRDAADYIRSLEGFATSTLLIPEQSWDSADSPEAGLKKGRPTGSATPLAWAHAEYIQLLRSVADGQVFATIPAVTERYRNGRPDSPPMQFWTFAYQLTRIAPGTTIRIIAKADFELTYTLDGWTHVQKIGATTTEVGICFAEVAIPAQQQTPLTFTFYWHEDQRWEGRNFEVRVEGRS